MPQCELSEEARPMIIEDQFRGVDEAIARKMLWDNVRREYRLGAS
jgi:hypothetical protein